MKQAVPSPVYLESSAFVKLFLAEAASNAVNRIVAGRKDVMISELCLTEVVSALARRAREGVLAAADVARIYAAMLAAIDGVVRRVHLTQEIHRAAERMLLMTRDVPLRTLDALHLAAAVETGARSIVTFDRRIIGAAPLAGIVAIEVH